MPLSRRVFLMVCDGLRPDLAAEHMPALARLGAEGAVVRRSHAVAPTVTRANSASLATGVYPRRHGIAGNELWAPGVHGGRPFSTAAADRLDELRAGRAGHVVQVPTLADRVHAAGGRTAVVGTGSSGAALLQNPLGHERADLLLHPSRFSGLTRAQCEGAHGPIPPRETPNTAQDAYFTRLITDVILPAGEHDLVVFWHTEPDHTQHAHGLGHPLTNQALRGTDADLAAILDAIADRPEPWIVAVVSDHGFSTIDSTLGTLDLAGALVAAGLKAGPTSSDVVPVDCGVYLAEDAMDRGEAVVEALHAHPAVGAVFSGGGGAPVRARSMSRELIGQGGELAPDIMYSVAWSEAANGHGVAGLCAGAGGRLAGTHGSLSPLEVRNTLMLAGEGVRPGVVSDVPAGIVDAAPTLAHLLGIPWNGPCDGRVLRELLDGGPSPDDVAVGAEELEVDTGTGVQSLVRARVHDTTYVVQAAVG